MKCLQCWRMTGCADGFPACSANDRPGAFAEYLVVDYDLVFLIAPHMSYNEAAAIPLCSLTAAQGTFFRNGLASPFWQTASSPSNSEHSDGDRSSPTNVFIYGSATSLGMYAAQMVQLAKKVAKQPIRLIGAASGKHMAYLKAAPYLYDAVVDYHDKDWPAQVRQSLDGGAKGVDYAVDAISELPMVLQINELLGPNGKQAIFRSPKAVGYLAEWEAMDRKPQYGGVWEGLKHEIRYSSKLSNPEMNPSLLRHVCRPCTQFSQHRSLIRLQMALCCRSGRRPSTSPSSTLPISPRPPRRARP
jgi:NADPH:quinone reductase-like Zn-dependent oxidoreductase